MGARALAAGSTTPIRIPSTPAEAQKWLDALDADGEVAVVVETPKPEPVAVAAAAPVTEPVAVVEAAPVVKAAPKAVAPVATPSALDPILFAFSRNSLGTQGKKQFEILYKYMKENAAVKIKITGYTDSEGSDNLNDRLAVKRAIEIKLLLMERGIAKNRMRAIGKGAKDPVAPNKKADNSDNDAGRTLNRRVEFEVIK